MKRFLASWLLAVTTITATLATNAAPVAADDTPGGCVEPVGERRYSRDQLSYRLAVDLTDCDWWDHRHIKLDAEMQRVSPDGDGGGAGTLTFCGATAFAPESEDMADEGASAFDGAAGAGSRETATGGSDETGTRSGSCAVEVTMHHPPLDGGIYKGAITFPWQGGPRTVSFNAFCSAATGCVDLPVDPTTALAPAADLYDAIAGDDDAD